MSVAALGTPVGAAASCETSSKAQLAAAPILPVLYKQAVTQPVAVASAASRLSDEDLLAELERREAAIVANYSGPPVDGMGVYQILKLPVVSGEQLGLGDALYGMPEVSVDKMPAKAVRGVTSSGIAFLAFRIKPVVADANYQSGVIVAFKKGAHWTTHSNVGKTVLYSGGGMDAKEFAQLSAALSKGTPIMSITKKTQAWVVY